MASEHTVRAAGRLVERYEPRRRAPARKPVQSRKGVASVIHVASERRYGGYASATARIRGSIANAPRRARAPRNREVRYYVRFINTMSASSWMSSIRGAWWRIFSRRPQQGECRYRPVAAAANDARHVARTRAAGGGATVGESVRAGPS